MVDVTINSDKEKFLYKLNVPPNSSVKDVKSEIRKQNGLAFSRQSLRLHPRGKDQRDNFLLEDIGLSAGGTVYLKDLGRQIGWKTVFIMEYLGPLIIYWGLVLQLFLQHPTQYILFGKRSKLSYAGLVAAICWTLHYVKRLYETLYVHRFSHGTMPIFNLFKNCAYYWGFAFYIAYHINHPLYTPPSNNQIYLGFVIFFLCESGNACVHLLLRDLRPEGSGIRKIPCPNGILFNQLFDYVSCPNYTYEFGSWIGFSIISSCLPALIFAIAGLVQMSIWAVKKNKIYKKEFPNYPKRYAIIPFLL